MENNVTDPTKLLLQVEEELREISAYGLTYCRNAYDLENYTKIQKIAIKLLETFTNNKFHNFTVMEKKVYSRPTPLLITDGAIVRNETDVLFIRRTDSGNWALPGGHVDIHEAITEAVKREILEEVGLRVEPIALIGLFNNGEDSRYLIHSYTATFACKEISTIITDGALFNIDEVLETCWFSKETFPFSDCKDVFSERIHKVFDFISGNRNTYFS